MEIGLEEFNKYKKLIWQKCHYYSKKYHVDYDEVESQAYFIFTIALQKYNPSISKFSTFLVSELQWLQNFCQRQNKLETEFSEEIDFDSFQAREEGGLENFVKVQSRIESELSLSPLALEIVQYILYGDWEKEEYLIRERKPTKANFSIIERYFTKLGHTSYSLKKAWKEIFIWWNSGAYLEY